MAEAPSGTLTFLFTDIERSTAQWEADRPAMEAAVEMHDDIVRGAIESHGGYVFATTGDGFAAAFSSAVEATDAAASAQQGLESASWPPNATLTVRMGLHSGTAQERAGDYFGPDVNRAARVMAAAHGGQILVSAPTAALLTNQVPLTDLGVHRLKDLRSPEVLHQLGNGVFPSPRTLDAVRHNLPVERTPLWGRDADVTRVREELSADRLVTLLGIGGIGKTRLALAVAAESVESHPDGVWFVDLTTATTAADVVATVASAMGVAMAHEVTPATLARLIRDHRTLLVLDNCEHVIDAVAHVIDALLDQAREVRVLATSREPLDLPGEHQSLVEPLATNGAGSPAITLLRSCAQRVGVELDADDLDAATELCARLDGLPLAIELAAAQLRQLNLDELLDRLDQRLALLAKGRRADRRQASLGAVLDGTWALLDPEEDRMAQALAAFPATFSLGDVEGLVTGMNVGLPATTLARLVERGLVVRESDGRHRLLETVRLAARQRWPTGTGADHPVERHVRWVLASVHVDEFATRHLGAGAFERSHPDDVRAVEGQLAEAGRIRELVQLLGGARGLGPAAASAAIDRLTGYLDELPLDGHQRGMLAMSMTLLGLAARRPESIERGGRVAVENLRSYGSDRELACALVADAWIPALSDSEAALERLVEAEALAEMANEPALRDHARIYRAVFLAVHRRTEEARIILAEVWPRLEGLPDHDQVTLLMLAGELHLVSDPARALGHARAFWDRMATETRPFFIHPIHVALAAGVADDVAFFRAAIEAARAAIDEEPDEDGLPDLLLPFAALAWARSDPERAARWLTAVRGADRPTHNFFTTIAYRELRGVVGLVAEDPLTGSTLEQIRDDAQAWFDGLVEGHASAAAD